MQPQQVMKPILAYALSLAAGLLIVVGSVMMFGFGFPYTGTMMGGYYPMMGVYYHMMPWVGGWNYAAVIGVAAGAVVLLGAVLLYVQPEKATTWGAVILVFSVLGLLGMGGFFLGSVLGVLGGVLAIAAMPPAGQATA